MQLYAWLQYNRSTDILSQVYIYAKQKHLGYKKGEANQKQQLSDLYIHATKSLISAKAKN